jgi:hypothetical protein
VRSGSFNHFSFFRSSVFFVVEAHFSPFLPPLFPPPPLFSFRSGRVEDSEAPPLSDYYVAGSRKAENKNPHSASLLIRQLPHMRRRILAWHVRRRICA